MVPAIIPQNESARLKALRETGLLDTAREAEFDEIVKFASLLCNTPISLISLIDANRQWFKAAVGLNVAETSRDIAFCSHAILNDQLFEIPDATKDIRFSDNPLVTDGPEIRFYAGMPLVTSTGDRLGTLCVIDKVPGQLTEMQKLGLSVLAHNVIKITELRTRNKDLHFLTETQKRTISILAHDVRNPLASIKNIIELKQSDLLDTHEAAEMLEMVTGQLDSTIQMVDNVVNWGQLQLQFGHLQLVSFNLHHLVERIFGSEKLKSIAKNNQLINLVSPASIIHSDEQSLEFILRNLVSNADKFTENGSITIYAQRMGTKTLITITDTGIGMTKARAGELLTASNPTSTLGTDNEKGSGLGLPLVKEFVERLDGTITVESKENAGTTFKITI